MPLNKSWHDYNESLIERVYVSFLKSSNKEIKKINKCKVGAPFQYSDRYVQFLSFLKIGFKIPYRMVQGVVRDYLNMSRLLRKYTLLILGEE